MKDEINQEIDYPLTSQPTGPILGLLKWQQEALISLDVALSDLMQNLAPILRQPDVMKESTEKPTGTHTSVFAQELQANTEKIERLTAIIKDMHNRCEL